MKNELDESQTDKIIKGQSLTLYSRSIGDYTDVPFILWYGSPSVFFVAIFNGEVQIHNSYNGEKGTVRLFDNSVYKYIHTDKKKHTRYYE